MRFKTIHSLGLFLIPLLSLSPAAEALDGSFSGRVDEKIAEHTNAPVTPASYYGLVLLEGKANLSREWSLVGGFQGWIEGIYNDVPVGVPLRSDFYEVLPQDTYVQFKNSGFTMRLGNQQVVWGETFGNFYADIVNPKDLRQGIPLDVRQIRRSIPMLMLRYIAGPFSLQGLYIMRSSFNLLPLPGSDYVAVGNSIPGFQQVQIFRETTLPWFAGGGEYGTRAALTIGKFDLSVFYLNYFDRMPHYRIADSTPGVLLNVNEVHSRMYSVGSAIAGEIGAGYVVRAEAVGSLNKVFPTLTGSAVGEITADENLYCLSLDFPTWKRLNFSVQGSASARSKEASWLYGQTRESFFSARASIDLFSASNWLTTYTSNLSDRSTRLQTEFTFPVSSATEIRPGFDYYFGPAGSQFGDIPRASRAYVLLRILFNN